MRLAPMAACLVLTFAPAVAHAQDDVAAFYKDKQIRILVGSAAGSGFDLNARLLSRHWPQHIPGRPGVVVQNQPGGGSVTMANGLLASGPRDGTVVGAAINGMPTAPLLQPEIARYEMAKVAWIGSTNRDTVIAFSWHTADVQSVADLKVRELAVGATSVGTAQYDFPVAARAIAGLKFKTVVGYKGTTDILLALERGEVQGVGALAVQSLRALNPGWIAERKVKVILQYGLEPHRDLAGVPTLLSLATTPDDALALRLLLARLEYGRPFFASPEVPPERLAALRRAFDATMRDPAYMAEAEKMGLEVSPMSGADMAQLIGSLASTPPAVVQRVRSALAAPPGK